MDRDPQREVRFGEIERGEVHELPPTNHLGYKDVACREFRARYEDEYIEPMSRPTQVERFADPHETVEKVNPEYDPVRSGSYEQNCADCARCFERTWRGDREEAAGRAETPDARGNMAVRGELSERTEAWAGETFTRTEDVAAMKARLDAAGHGASAIIQSNWENGPFRGGHAYNAVNHEGRVLVVDGQNHEVHPWHDQTIHPGFKKSSGHRIMMWDADGKRVL